MQVDSEIAHPPGNGSYRRRVCSKCGWTYPKSRPSAKQRRAHKKVCGSIVESPPEECRQSFHSVVSDAARSADNLLPDEHNDDDKAAVQEILSASRGSDDQSIAERVPDRCQDEVLPDAVSGFINVSLSQDKGAPTGAIHLDPGDLHVGVTNTEAYTVGRCQQENKPCNNQYLTHDSEDKGTTLKVEPVAANVLLSSDAFNAEYQTTSSVCMDNIYAHNDREDKVTTLKVVDTFSAEHTASADLWSTEKCDAMESNLDLYSVTPINVTAPALQDTVANTGGEDQTDMFELNAFHADASSDLYPVAIHGANAYQGPQNLQEVTGVPESPALSIAKFMSEFDLVSPQSVSSDSENGQCLLLGQPVQLNGKYDATKMNTQEIVCGDLGTAAQGACLLEKRLQTDFAEDAIHATASEAWSGICTGQLLMGDSKNCSSTSTNAAQVSKGSQLICTSLAETAVGDICKMHPEDSEENECQTLEVFKSNGVDTVLLTDGNPFDGTKREESSVLEWSSDHGWRNTKKEEKDGSEVKKCKLDVDFEMKYVVSVHQKSLEPQNTTTCDIAVASWMAEEFLLSVQEMEIGGEGRQDGPFDDSKSNINMNENGENPDGQEPPWQVVAPDVEICDDEEPPGQVDSLSCGIDVVKMMDLITSDEGGDAGAKRMQVGPIGDRSAEGEDQAQPMSVFEKVSEFCVFHELPKLTVSTSCDGEDEFPLPVQVEDDLDKVDGAIESNLQEGAIPHARNSMSRDGKVEDTEDSYLSQSDVASDMKSEACDNRESSELESEVASGMNAEACENPEPSQMEPLARHISDLMVCPAEIHAQVNPFKWITVDGCNSQEGYFGPHHSVVKDQEDEEYQQSEDASVEASCRFLKRSEIEVKRIQASCGDCDHSNTGIDGKDESLEGREPLCQDFTSKTQFKLCDEQMPSEKAVASGKKTEHYDDRDPSRQEFFGKGDGCENVGLVEKPSSKVDVKCIHFKWHVVEEAGTRERAIDGDEQRNMYKQEITDTLEDQKFPDQAVSFDIRGGTNSDQEAAGQDISVSHGRVKVAETGEVSSSVLQAVHILSECGAEGENTYVDQVVDDRSKIFEKEGLEDQEHLQEEIASELIVELCSVQEHLKPEVSAGDCEVGVPKVLPLADQAVTVFRGYAEGKHLKEELFDDNQSSISKDKKDETLEDHKPTESMVASNMKAEVYDGHRLSERDVLASCDDTQGTGMMEICSFTVQTQHDFFRKADPKGTGKQGGCVSVDQHGVSKDKNSGIPKSREPQEQVVLSEINCDACADEEPQKRDSIGYDGTLGQFEVLPLIMPVHKELFDDSCQCSMIKDAKVEGFEIHESSKLVVIHEKKSDAISVQEPKKHGDSASQGGIQMVGMADISSSGMQANCSFIENEIVNMHESFVGVQRNLNMHEKHESSENQNPSEDVITTICGHVEAVQPAEVGLLMEMAHTQERVFEHTKMTENTRDEVSEKSWSTINERAAKDEILLPNDVFDGSSDVCDKCVDGLYSSPKDSESVSLTHTSSLSQAIFCKESVDRVPISKIQSLQQPEKDTDKSCEQEVVASFNVTGAESNIELFSTDHEPCDTEVAEPSLESCATSLCDVESCLQTVVLQEGHSTNDHIGIHSHERDDAVQRCEITFVSALDGSADSLAQTDFVESHRNFLTDGTIQAPLCEGMTTRKVECSHTDLEEPSPGKPVDNNSIVPTDKLVESQADTGQPSVSTEIHLAQDSQLPIHSDIVSSIHGTKEIGNQEIVKKTMSWSSEKSHIPLRHLFVETINDRQSHSQRGQSLQADELTASKANSEPHTLSKPSSIKMELEKEWNSPVRLEVSRRVKRKTKGRGYWVPFVCCSSLS